MKIIKVSVNKRRLKFLIEKIDQYNEEIKSFKGNGYAILKNGKTTKTFRLNTIFGNDYVDYSILIKDFVFQKPIAVLIKKGQGPIILYDYIKREKSSYPDTSKIFKKILNFDIPKGNLFIQSLGLRVPILKGVTPKLHDSNSIEFDFEDGKEIVYATDEIPNMITYLHSNINMTIKFDKIKKLKNRSLPSRILITIGKTTLEINYKAFDVNGDYSSMIKLDQ